MRLDKCFVYQNTLYVREVILPDEEVVFTDDRGEALCIDPEHSITLEQIRETLRRKGYLGHQITEREYNPYGRINSPAKAVLVDCSTGKETGYTEFSQFIRVVKNYERAGQPVIHSERDTDTGTLYVAEALKQGGDETK